MRFWKKLVVDMGKLRWLLRLWRCRRHDSCISWFRIVDFFYKIHTNTVNIFTIFLRVLRILYSLHLFGVTQVFCFCWVFVFVCFHFSKWLKNLIRFLWVTEVDITLFISRPHSLFLVHLSNTGGTIFLVINQVSSDT